MADPTEIAAVKASFLGALSASEALAALRDRMAALDPRIEIPRADLEDLARLGAANAVAAAALRGLVETMMRRRGDTPTHEP